MVNNVKKEEELYPEMRNWLSSYLSNKYEKNECETIVVDCHSIYLDSVLEQYDVIQYFPQTVGLKIQIDVLGIVKWENQAKIFCIEAKKTALTLQNLGQLQIYCKLCNPEEAFLLSSKNLGALEKVIIHLNREDILDFGSGKTIKKINVAKWDISRKTISQESRLPKI